MEEELIIDILKNNQYISVLQIELANIFIKIVLIG